MGKTWPHREMTQHVIYKTGLETKAERGSEHWKPKQKGLCFIRLCSVALFQHCTKGTVCSSLTYCVFQRGYCGYNCKIQMLPCELGQVKTYGSIQHLPRLELFCHLLKKKKQKQNTRKRQICSWLVWTWTHSPYLFIFKRALHIANYLVTTDNS